MDTLTPTSDGRFVVTLTASQRLALLHVLTTVMHPPVQMQGYYDRGTTTTPADLLTLVLHAEVVR